MCNSCDCFSPITFPGFVGQSCCNPCCPDSGSVGGTSDSSHRCCFCFDCDMCQPSSSGSQVLGVSDNGNSYSGSCGCGNYNACNNCGSCNSCNSCGYQPPVIPGCDCSNGWQPCCGAR